MYLRVVVVIFLSSIVFSWFLIFLIVSTHNSPKPSVTSVITESSSVYINSTTDWAFGSFVINNSNKCDKTSKGVNLLILIHSSVTHFGFRDVIRKHKRIDRSVIVFLLGFLNDPGLQVLIEQESRNYGDLVQASFHDSYQNLTLKHILGLSWAAKFCAQAQLVLKLDDDIFVNHQLLTKMLDLRYPKSQVDPLVSRTSHKLIACYIQHKMKVIRNTTSRWYVSELDYKYEYYPDFCSGWAYITTIDVINDLLNQIPNYRLFWIDDVFITGILRQSVPDIELESLNKLFNVDVSYLYYWISDSLFHKYKWRYVFSNANGDLSLLSTAFATNQMTGHHICCYPPLTDLAQETRIPLKPINSKGIAKQISI